MARVALAAVGIRPVVDEPGATTKPTNTLVELAVAPAKELAAQQPTLV